jgi:hypothetical protein
MASCRVKLCCPSLSLFGTRLIDSEQVPRPCQQLNADARSQRPRTCPCVPEAQHREEFHRISATLQRLGDDGRTSCNGLPLLVATRI